MISPDYTTILHTRPRAAGHVELAARAGTAVALYRAAGPDTDAVTLRGDAIAACMEAALARGGDRARWTLEAERLRGDEPAYDREERRR